MAEEDTELIMANPDQQELIRKYEFREEIIRNLVTDLVGPGAPDEIIDELPLDRYISGVLWPTPSDTVEGTRDTVVEDPESEAAQSNDGVADTPVASSRMSAPSSIGMTFSIDTDSSSTVTLTASAASYSQIGDTKHPGDLGSRAVNGSWQRTGSDFEPVEVDLKSANGVPSIIELATGKLQMYVLARKPEGSIVTVTAVLRNTMQRPPSPDLRDGSAWFQVALKARTRTPAIVDRTKSRENASEDPDLATSQLLYRNRLTFGAGHGCAAKWPESVSGNRVDSVETTFVPRAPVPPAESGSTTANLSMSFLGSAEYEDVAAELETLCLEYETWIDTCEAQLSATGVESIPEHLRPTAESHLEAAREAVRRVRNGIEFLQQGPAFEAFQLANRSMRLQRSRQDWVRSKSGLPFVLTEQSWRPFQIAFILINLPSVVDRSSPEREIADLLWFPTGGGKTEAYLGLIAFLIAFRRLRDPDVEGTAVIMRYTLRLLTIQQFERAAMLMCSLETVRREDPDRLGERSFGVGLWVGSASTPNSIFAARRAIKKISAGQSVEEGNPVQLHACPWCGTALDVDDYHLPKGEERLRIICSSRECEFSTHDGLPVHVVDEDVYRQRPELIIGTVDKFAQMTWNANIATLFGRMEPNDIGPDLIIQDELHLISGPLGSTVGLFETAVDIAAGGAIRDSAPYRPKLIASTATIRRAGRQIRSVFDRSSRLFPPPGFNPNDSFFARPAENLERGDREYVGVMAPGTSHASLMVRTYASLLHTVRTSTNTPDDIRDIYWTLVGYFNSLRVLGSAYLQVNDDVRGRLRLLASKSDSSVSSSIDLEELTSRQPSSEIPRTLKRLETGMVDSGTPIDVVLATNMISVGLDVDRLGLMAVMGQPPSSAEYIQATSRVGRKHPGLVVAIFNSAKSRDRSHYEGFSEFHSALYRAVEATSATPFAARSRDRALHAVLVAALRMVDPTLRGNNDAGSFRSSGPVVESVQELLLDRARRVTRQDDAAFAATQSDLARLIEVWSTEAASPNGIRVYRDEDDPHSALLIDAAQAMIDDRLRLKSRWDTPWSTPQSMRDVDAETAMQIANMSSRQQKYESERD